MKIVALIPARGGSKGIPKKNIVDVGGKPLICWTIEAALEAKHISDVIVSTDDQMIADIARKAGATVPFLRPKEHAEDEIGALPVIQHLMDWLDHEGTSYDAIAYLQPTSPLRNANDIDNAAQLMENVDSVVSVCKVPHNMLPASLMTLEGKGRLRFSVGRDNVVLRRQDKTSDTPLYARNGPAILMSKKFVFAEGDIYGGTISPYEMPNDRSFDIDNFEDLELVRKLIS